jgi:PLP dependent protein
MTIDWSTVSVEARIHQIRQSLPASVRLIAVSKQVSTSLIRDAYAAGVRDFGESRVQEAIAKQVDLCDLPDINWHLIGHLQTNKARKALEHFQWIHSVDNLKLAERLNDLAKDLAHPPQICLQVKMMPDPSKSGWSIPELRAALPQLASLQRIRICGLMTIPPQDLELAEVLELFQKTRDLAIELQHRVQPESLLSFQELSMGMSDDYRLAVQAGSTMVRLGRILFGERS